jgi:hypothetical protein
MKARLKYWHFPLYNDDMQIYGYVEVPCNKPNSPLPGSTVRSKAYRASVNLPPVEIIHTSVPTIRREDEPYKRICHDGGIHKGIIPIIQSGFIIDRRN